MTTIPQRELRNNISEVLRRAEAGEHFTITVHGRPVAELTPRRGADRRWGTYEGFLRLMDLAPADGSWAKQLRQMRDEDDAAAVDTWQ